MTVGSLRLLRAWYRTMDRETRRRQASPRRDELVEQASVLRRRVYRALLRSYARRGILR
jgi:hypothetical protein